MQRLAMGDPTLRVHLIGIGGAGLSAIATVLLEMGVKVSGSDRQANTQTRRLAEAGATIFARQEASNFDQFGTALPDVTLISSAVDAANPERRAAQTLGLPVVKRSEFLSALLANRRVIAVAGTHGKSTTTSMIVFVLRNAGIDAGYIIGAHLPGYGNAAAGSSPFFVIEADEYDHMFLGLSPTAAVVANVEWDHPDFYVTPASYRRAFMQFVDSVARHGVIVACRDDAGAEHLREYSASRGPRWITYGLNADADIRAENVQGVPGGGSHADLTVWKAHAGRLELQAPGIHNVRNALAAIAIGGWCDVPVTTALAALSQFQGVDRRFELKGEVAGVTIIDDYAHNPAKVAATLAGARLRYPQRRIWAFFQPHTYSRTRELLRELAASFGDADEVIVSDIYAAREADDGRVGAADLVAASPHPSIRHIGALTDAASYLAEHVRRGDVVITMGAGDGNRVGDLLMAHLAAKREANS
jgi:UDP-N-acetylmuramate--alanine ligase